MNYTIRLKQFSYNLSLNHFMSYSRRADEAAACRNLQACVGVVAPVAPGSGDDAAGIVAGDWAAVDVGA